MQYIYHISIKSIILVFVLLFTVATMTIVTYYKEQHDREKAIEVLNSMMMEHQNLPPLEKSKEKK